MQTPLPIGATEGRPLRRRLLIAVAAGTILRIACLPLSSPEGKPVWGAIFKATSAVVGLPPRDDGGVPADWSLHAWPADHGAYVQWGRHAVQHGWLSLYTRPPDPRIKVRISSGEHWIHEGSGLVANYPPLSLALIALEGHVLRLLEPLTLPRDEQGRRSPPQFVANTIIARCVFQAPGVVFDGLLALAVMRLTRRLADERAARLAFILTYLSPPFWLDSCWWGQTESWVLAPGVFMTEMLVRRRWTAAGVAWGVALGLKTQALLFAPVWAWAFFTETRSGAPKPEPWRVVRGAATALLALNALAAPFWMTSGSAWFMQSFVRNLLDEAPHTTLKAFNIWYLDLLRTLDTSVSATWAGLSKDAWGKAFLAGGLMCIARRVWRAGASSATGTVVFAGAWLLAAVMLPTRVHERYVLLCLPFLIAAMLRLPALRWGVAGLIVVATLQVTVHHWLDIPADAWSLKLEADTRRVYREAVRQTPPEHRSALPATEEEALALRYRNFVSAHRRYAPWEGAATLLALGAAVQIFVAAGRGDRFGTSVRRIGDEGVTPDVRRER
ncbi:MAG: hypothetical protein FLDDKLPJ_00782 [Phycisphaerae bacterium]|nr:hypothetical protein [Phycisphaerae bacterium]